MAGRRLKALITAPVAGPGLDLLRQVADVVIDPWIDHEPLRIYDADQLAARAEEENADLLIVEADRCAGPVFERDLIAVCSCRGDPTNVDVDAATKAGIPVIRAPGRNADAVAELTVALLLAATRGVVTADLDVRKGDVYKDGTIPYQRFRAWQIAGRTAGLIGLGAVGRATKWRLEGLGMNVIASDPFASDATFSLDELLERADVVSMHVGVNPDTTKMIGTAQFEEMKDGVVYVNSARAQLHDTDALVAALQSGKVAAAGLDHFEGEWLAPDHPLVSMPNVVLTPHIGGATFDTEVNHTRIIAEDLIRLLAGATPLNCVNPEVLRDRS
ncbi:MAG: NAD(P)-dependent oxidoreductase [Acidimicrobiales bacterium]